MLEIYTVSKIVQKSGPLNNVITVQLAFIFRWNYKRK